MDTQAKWWWMQRLCGVSLVLLLTAVCRTEALELFPFETHQRLPQGSDESALLTLTTPLVIQQQNYSAVTVSSPGGTPPCPFNKLLTLIYILNSIHTVCYAAIVTCALLSFGLMNSWLFIHYTGSQWWIHFFANCTRHSVWFRECPNAFLVLAWLHSCCIPLWYW